LAVVLCQARAATHGQDECTGAAQAGGYTAIDL
jgi:hypothetical protein